jgi:FixJ family two-component response regulator
VTGATKAKAKLRVQPADLPISVVDDDESVREAVAGLMHWLGYQVKTYASAIDFLASPEFSESLCIIADVQMPQMSGIELYNHLKTLGYRIPTILITAYPNDSARTATLADGVVCYLSKPFDKDSLIGCVRTALQSQPG